MKGRLRSQMMNVTLKDEDYKKKSKFESNFAFKKRLTDPRFGEISIVQNPKTRQLLAVRERKINDKKTAGQEIVNCKNRLGHKHPNLLNLLDYSVTKQSELCSSFYVIKEFFEYPKSDLSREIQMKEREGETMSHKDLTHVLYQQIAVNSYLQNKDMSHGDIQPINITWDKNTKTSKLIDKSTDNLDPRRVMQIQKNRLVSGHKLYQSPTLYKNLKKGNLKADYSRNKEDTFALGLSILEAGNGKSVQNIYNKAKGEVDEQKLQEHVNEFNGRYGQQNTLLCSTVASMVDPDEKQRPDFKNLESQIPNYEDVKKYLDNDDVNFNHDNSNNYNNNYNNNNNYHDVPYNYNNNNQANTYAQNDSNDYWNQQEIKNADKYEGIKEVNTFQPKPFAQVNTPNVNSVPRRSLNNSQYSNQEMQNYQESPFIKKNNNKVIVNASNDNLPPTNNQVLIDSHDDSSPYVQQQIPQQNISQQQIPQQNTSQQQTNLQYNNKPNVTYNTSTQMNTTHNSNLNTTTNTNSSRVYYDHASNYPKLQYAPQPVFTQSYVSVHDQQQPGYQGYTTYSDKHVTYQSNTQPHNYGSQRITQTYVSEHPTTYRTTHDSQQTLQELPVQSHQYSTDNHVVRRTTVQQQGTTQYRPSTQIIQQPTTQTTQYHQTSPYKTVTQGTSQQRIVYTQNDHVSGEQNVQGGLRLLRTYEDPSHSYKKN